MNFDLFPAHTRDALRKLGFSDNEVRVLGCLLLKKKAITQDVSQQTALSYSVVRLALSTLASRGLAMGGQNGETEMFMACSDDHLLHWIEGQKKVVTKSYDDASMNIRAFLEVAKQSTWKPTVLYYEGVEELKQIYQDILDEGQDVYCWTDLHQMSEQLGEEFVQYLVRERVRKQFTLNVIRPEYVDKKVKKSGIDDDELLRNIKVVPELNLEGEIRIYGSKVAFITFEENKPVGFVFHGEVSARLFRHLFNLYWGSL